MRARVAFNARAKRSPAMIKHLHVHRRWERRGPYPRLVRAVINFRNQPQSRDELIARVDTWRSSSSVARVRTARARARARFTRELRRTVACARTYILSSTRIY